MTRAAFGRYRVIGDIPGGNMGRIYLAEDPEIDRRVVVKALDGQFDQEQRARFVREARAAGRLSHRHVVSVFDVGEQDRTPFIVMEYVAGETLAAIIRRPDSLSDHRRLDLLEQLCVGLDYAHEQRVIHRDIKPSNLMVDGSGTLRILDFGIARIEGDKTSTAVLGTMNYMSPEQWSGGEMNRRTDIFSVGAVAYELFSGRRAFPGASAPDVFRAVMADGPDPLEIVCPTAPLGLSDVVRRMLARTPDDRFESLKAALPAIRRIKSQMSPADDREASLPPELAPTRSHESFPVTVAPSSAETQLATPPRQDHGPSVAPVVSVAKAQKTHAMRPAVVAAAIVMLALVAVVIAFFATGGPTTQTAATSVPPASEPPTSASPSPSPTPSATATSTAVTTSSPLSVSTPPVTAGRSPAPRSSPTSGRRGSLPPECNQLLERFSSGVTLTDQEKEFLKKRCGG